MGLDRGQGSRPADTLDARFQHLLLRHAGYSYRRATFGDHTEDQGYCANKHQEQRQVLAGRHCI